MTEPIARKRKRKSKSRYADWKDQDEDIVYMPPRINLDGMTKEQIAQHSMRHFGVRPDQNALKADQIAEVQRRMRAGRPSYQR